ncbi:MAG: serine/threonine protein kinase [Gammaproteobacteria bacterium]|nr:serine/threonine protein kinase [Gammaproteobacteria bacterium]
MRQLRSTLTLLLAFCAAPAWATNFSFTESNALVASIAGTPAQQRADHADVPAAQQRDLRLQALPERQLPRFMRELNQLTVRLAWQNEPAPLVFLIAGTGSRFDTPRLESLKNALWHAGMHVMLLSSPTNYDFIAAASANGRPGLGPIDAEDLHRVMRMAAEQAEQQVGLEVTDYRLAGFSLGALNAAWLDHWDHEQGSFFDFQRVLLMHPPVDLLTSIRRLDGMAQVRLDNLDNQDGFFEHIFEKLVSYYAEGGGTDIGTGLFYDFQASNNALTDGELALLIGAVFRFSAADITFMSDLISGQGVFAPAMHGLNASTPLTPYLRRALQCNFGCYIDNLLWPWWQQQNPDGSFEQMAALGSLRTLSEQLADPRFGVMTSADDFILSADDYHFLRDTFGPRGRFYPRGGHGGILDHADVVDWMVGFLEGSP